MPIANNFQSTALLLARLEQENNMLVSNPKSGIAKVQVVEKERDKRMSRPPSIQHLKRLVNGPTPPALRYSMLPPPPMTDLEFYAALVQDYNRTAQYLPTLLSKKIRSGVPPPLRGVVWQSMSGARDRLLEDEFDRLCGESSPYEGIIGKDLGRSFPGVEMFRDPEGDGQRMLGRVLKCFSLYDHKIGYCQGLGFIVGPLLMHMGDKQAFCVLVRYIASQLLADLENANHAQINGTLRPTKLLPSRLIWSSCTNTPIPRVAEATFTRTFRSVGRPSNRSIICFAMVPILLRRYVSFTNALPNIRCYLCRGCFGNNNESCSIAYAEKRAKDPGLH